MEEEKVVGRRPNSWEKYWIDAAKAMTPDKLDKSVERLDNHGKFLFSTVSIVGTFLAGFSVFTPLGGTILRSKWLLLPSSLICSSLAFAMMGLTPIASKICLSEPESIARYYKHVIQWRGFVIGLASVLFALGLLSIAIVTAFVLAPPPISPTISSRLTGEGINTTLTSKIEVEHMPPSSLLVTKVIGVADKRSGSERSILFQDTSNADQTGKVMVSSELNQLQHYNKFVILVIIQYSNKDIYQKQVDISRPNSKRQL